jgi:hypothetical protein
MRTNRLSFRTVLDSPPDLVVVAEPDRWRIGDRHDLLGNRRRSATAPKQQDQDGRISAAPNRTALHTDQTSARRTNLTRSTPGETLPEGLDLHRSIKPTLLAGSAPTAASRPGR